MLVKVLKIGQPQFEKATSCLYLTKGRAPGYVRNISLAQSYVSLECESVDSQSKPFKVYVNLQVKKLFPKWRNTNAKILDFSTRLYPIISSYLLNREVEIIESKMTLSMDINSCGDPINFLPTIPTFDLIDFEYSAILAIL